MAVLKQQPISSRPVSRPPLFVAPTVYNTHNGAPVIRTVLIANRGEIACRIIDTCRKVGIRTVAIYVKEDEDSRYVQLADEAVFAGSILELALNPFLDIEYLIKTALSTQADTVHPGYGYLSENGNFATKVREARLIFIGPTASAMDTLGDKRSSKAFLKEHAPQVPLIPGFMGSSQQSDELEEAAVQIGLPVMLKASAGGGGKGMRVIRDKSQIKSELERAQSEAQRFFGSSDCILEKYIEKSKHVEIQIMGDSHGNVVSFFERECSVQRRHQKVIEESPCPFLTPELRKKMSDCAVSIATLIGYQNAGTVEFVVDVDQGTFYFLEVNARLQVEHPITEEVTGVDLVALQLYVAAGGNLRHLPELAEVKQTGHAIECRLCAEDPQRNFFPENGTIMLWQTGKGRLGPGRDVRYETSVRSGSSVTIHFDSMIAKLVVWEPTRELAIKKMADVLLNTVCLGVKTNQFFMRNCLLQDAFRDPKYTTSFIPQRLPALLQGPADPAAQNLQKVASILPSVFLHKLRDSGASPGAHGFRSIRRNFRNQRFDPVSADSEVITTLDWPSSEEKAPRELKLCAHNPVASTQAYSSNLEYTLTSLPQDDGAALVSGADGRPGKTAAAATAARYNQISNLLRGQAAQTSDSASTKVSVLDYQPLPTSQQRTSAASLTLSVDGTIVRAKCVADMSSSSSRQPLQNDTPVTVYTHLPILGAQVRFQTSNLLTHMQDYRKTVEQAAAGPAERVVKAPMPCKILSVSRKDGDEVAIGDTVMVIESMKMEVSINTSVAGTFKTSRKGGEAVGEGSVLCEIV
ncbi:3-methylcrotonyl-CoA carboxylase alpha subunit [Microdochium nivale]|nr:3-methylcrotonyl-CoA carboxylase alpha subunit [Microdochium nivale]